MGGQGARGVTVLILDADSSAFITMIELQTTIITTITLAVWKK